MDPKVTLPVEETPPSVANKVPFGGWWKVGILAVGVLLAGSIAYAGYQYSQKQTPSITQPTPTPIAVTTPISDETANWKTYTSSDNSYLIKIPPTWNSLNCSYSVIFDPNPPSSCATDSPGTLSISVSNKTGESLVEIGKEFKVVTRNPLSIGGEQGEKVVTEKVEAAPGANNIIIAAVAHKGKVYTFNLQDTIQERIFDQILSTFKFLD